MSLAALEVGKGDEVILPVNTFIATAYAVLYVGAKPVFVDIDEETLNINANLIQEYVTKRTRAIIPVHLYGQVAGMDRIINLGKKHKLAVIEDACQAHGAFYNGKRAGSLGDLAAFSFYPSKNLGGFGDGGAITTNSSNLERKLRKLGEYGFTSKYAYNQIGFNSRLDAVQAIILGIKLKELDAWNKKRQQLAKYYNRRFKEIPFIRTPYADDKVSSVYYVYVIKVPKRDQLMKFLTDRGIETGIHYPIPLHLQKSLKHLGYVRGDFPVAETASTEILSLPIYPGLTFKQQDYIIKSVKDFFNS